MFFDGSYNNLGKIDSSLLDEIKNKIINISEDEWLDDSIERQQSFTVHKNVNNYNILFDYGNFQELDNNKTIDRRSNWSELDNIVDGEIVGLLIVNLHAGKDIPLHVDDGEHLKNSRRIHLPIITNKNVIFNVDGEYINMKEGYLYEINNMKPHSVKNKGLRDRIHIIIDVK